MLSTWAGTQPYVAESHVVLAWLQRELGNDSGAVQSLERALDVNPNYATALAHMGQYYEESGQLDEAVAYYQDSLHADWNQPEVHSRMAAASTGAGAESPMAATAMARGVHPYSIPRQQTAFGPPSAGAQMVQMQMMQTQMAMSGNPMIRKSDLRSVDARPDGYVSAGTFGKYVGRFNVGLLSVDVIWLAASNSPMTSMPTQTASFGEQMPMMSQPSETMTWPAGTDDAIGDAISKCLQHRHQKRRLLRHRIRRSRLFQPGASRPRSRPLLLLRLSQRHLHSESQ